MEIRKSILSTFAAKVLVSTLGLAMVILISRHLGAEGRGKIGLFMSSVALLQMFCDFGNSSVIINLSYKYSHKQLWLSSLLWVTAICLLSYPLLYFFRALPFIFLVPPAAFLYSFINLNQLLMMGNQRVGRRNISLLIMPALIIPLFLLLSHTQNKELFIYPLALFIALFVSAIFAFYFIKDKIIVENSPFTFQKDLLSMGVWVQTAQAIQFLNYRLNFFIVAAIIGDAALGVFNNAVILCESIWILGHSIGQILHLKILNSQDQVVQIRLTNKLIAYNFAGSVFLCILLLAIPNAFWMYLFTDEFAAMRGLFIYLIPGVLCFSISNIINHFLHAKGEFRKILSANALGLAFGATSALLFIPQYGLVAACLSWSIGLAVSLVFYIWQFKKLTKI